MSEEQLKIQKRVSLAFIATLVVQGVAFVWWAATTDATLSRANLDIRQLQTDVRSIRQDGSSVSVRLARVEEQVRQGNTMLEKILERITSK